MQIPLWKTSRKPRASDRSIPSFMGDSPPFIVRSRFNCSSNSTSSLGPTTRMFKDMIREETRNSNKVHHLFRRTFRSGRDYKLDIIISQLDAVIRRQDQISEKEEFMTGVLKECVREWKELPIDRIFNIESLYQAATGRIASVSEKLSEKISELDRRLTTQNLMVATEGRDMREEENEHQQHHDRENQNSSISHLRPGPIDEEIFSSFFPSRVAQHGAGISGSNRENRTSDTQRSSPRLKVTLSNTETSQSPRNDPLPIVRRGARIRSEPSGTRAETFRNKRRESFIDQQKPSSSPQPQLQPPPRSSQFISSPQLTPKDSSNSFVHQTRLRFEPPSREAKNPRLNSRGSLFHQPSQLFEPSRSNATASTPFHIRKKPSMDFSRRLVSRPVPETSGTSRNLARRESVIFLHGESSDDDAEISLKDAHVQKLVQTRRTNYERTHPSTEAMECRVARRRQSTHSLSDISEYSSDIPSISNS